MGVFQSVIQYAASRTPKKYRVPVTTGPQGQLDYGWVFGWEDIRFPPTRVTRGSNSLPDFDYTNLGLLFPENDASEKIYIITEFPHSVLAGSDIYPHVHFLQTTNTLPTFKMQYRRYENGGAVPSTFTELTSKTSTVYSYPGSDIVNVLEFPKIDGSDIVSVSSFMEIIFFRDDADITGDVLVKEVDIHVKADYVGSFQEYSK